MQDDDTTVRIPLRARDGSVRAYAIVDAADADWVNQWRWYLNRGYARRNIPDGVRRQRCIELHRALLGLELRDGVVVDHIDRNRLNCSRANLRIIPAAGNVQNVGSWGKTSAYRGVHFRKEQGKWRAGVRINKKQLWLGTFNTELEAAEAARSARARLMPFAVD